MSSGMIIMPNDRLCVRVCLLAHHIIRRRLSVTRSTMTAMPHALIAGRVTGWILRFFILWNDRSCWDSRTKFSELKGYESESLQ